MNRSLINAVLYQATWFASVIGASHGWWWTGAAMLVVFLAWQSLDVRYRIADLRLVAAALAVGLLIDTTLASSGLVAFAAPVPFVSLAPIWMLVLWASFALTLNHSLAILQKHIVIAALLGALGGPLAYWGAARGFHAVSFDPPYWRALSVLAIGWLAAMPLLVLLARHWSPPERLA